MKYLTLVQIKAIHTATLEDHGGLPGIRDPHGLAATVFRPQAAFSGELLYPTVEKNISALIEGLVAGHPFVDGNKRTGINTLEVFLASNSYRLDASDDEKFEFVMQIAKGKWKFAQIEAWLDGRVHPK